MRQDTKSLTVLVRAAQGLPSGGVSAGALASRRVYACLLRLVEDLRFIKKTSSVYLAHGEE